MEDFWRKFEWFVTRIESIIRSTSAISRFVMNTLTESGGGADWDQQAQDVWRELVHLYQRWGKISRATEDDNIRAQACNDANASGQFTRISQRKKNLPWEKDSIARVAYDPAHIPDCNVQASVGKHFLFNEPIPRGVNGRGYLRVTKKSLWWQHELFPSVWTSEGLTTCMENGYQWTINSTTWSQWVQVSYMVHPARAKINLPSECGRRRVDNHDSPVFRRRRTTI